MDTGWSADLTLGLRQSSFVNKKYDMSLAPAGGALRASK